MTLETPQQQPEILSALLHVMSPCRFNPHMVQVYGTAGKNAVFEALPTNTASCAFRSRGLLLDSM